MTAKLVSDATRTERSLTVEAGHQIFFHKTTITEDNKVKYVLAVSSNVNSVNWHKEISFPGMNAENLRTMAQALMTLAAKLEE